MSILKDEFLFDIDGSTLTIKQCPNNILTNSLVRHILENNDILNVVVCEGIEEIDSMGFWSGFTIKKRDVLTSRFFVIIHVIKL